VSWQDDPFGDSSIDPRPNQSTYQSGPATPDAADVGRWPLRSQIIVLMLVVGVAAVVGFAGFRTLASVTLSEDGWNGVSAWSFGLLLAATAAFAMLVLAIVVLARTEHSRLVPAIGLAAAVFLPMSTLYLGLRLGFDVARARVSSDIAALAANANPGGLIAWLLGVLS